MKLFLTKITEGSTKLWVPDLAKYGIPEHAPVFYNPVMSADRTLSVDVMREFFGRKKAEVADILSGLGARAVRYANEAGFDVTANDIQPSAIKLAQRNAKLNRVKIKTSVMEANAFLTTHKKEKFNAIDIDPFGSPANFLNSAFLAIMPKKSVLCVSATDLGALSGAYPTTCFRRYAIRADRSPFEHELGVRNLIATTLREGLKYNLSVKPLASYAHRHYYRLFLEVVGGKKTANRSLKNLGVIAYCKKCDWRRVYGVFETPEKKCECGADVLLFGPTWAAKIGEREFLERVPNPLAQDLAAEADFADVYTDVHSLSHKMKRETPRMADLFSRLEAQGYRVVRTHFSDYGIKTNAPFEAVRKVV